MLVPSFKLWIGIVEDRMDPEQLGRCRVRILGYHTADRQKLPTAELPWSVPIMPLTSPGVSGVGETPSLVHGTTVVGFFADGNDEQNPVIMGTLPGFPMEKITDANVGFNDPNGNWPRTDSPGYNGLNEPDISRLARGPDAESHASLKEKRRVRATEVPTARAPDVSNTSGVPVSGDQDNLTWDEPHARFGTTATGDYTAKGQAPTFPDGTTSVYPFNHVRETETGHIFEIDDTPGNGRIHEFHNSGTYREIQSDGTRVTRVVSRDVEIVLAGKDVSITGACNVTIQGDCKLLVEGDMYEEIRRDSSGHGGNKYTTIEGNRHTKVVGNDILEVMSHMGTQVGDGAEGSYQFKVYGDYDNTVIGNMTTQVGGGTNLISKSSVHVESELGAVHQKGVVISSVATAGSVHKGGLYYSAHGTKMDITATLDQKVATAGNQLIESGITQTLSATGLQNITAGVRQITTPITSHLGMYNVTGQILGTTVSTITGIDLNLHKHTAISLGAPTTPSIP